MGECRSAIFDQDSYRHEFTLISTEIITLQCLWKTAAASRMISRLAEEMDIFSVEKFKSMIKLKFYIIDKIFLKIMKINRFIQ